VRIRAFGAPPGPPLTDVDERELISEVRARFVEAVSRQMMSDVPYGAFLSGGLDSAAIVAAMARAAPTRPPLSFTIGFPGHGPELDERGAAAATATAIGASHRATAMEMTDFLGAVAASVRSVEEPWGGYQRSQAAAVLGVVDRIPGLARRPVGTLASALPRNERAKRAARLLDVDAGLARLLTIFEITTPQLRGALLRVGDHGEQASAERVGRASEVAGAVAGRDVLDQALYLDTHLFLPDQLLVWGDKTSMAASLEQRVPFLDQEFMKFVERIPARTRMRGARRKRLYRDAMRGLVPAMVFSRKKQPFATPYDDWLRASLGDEVSRRYTRDAPLGGAIDPIAVTRLVSEHQSGRFDHKRVLYCLLELSQWHREFVEGAP
jgi:asparagine synthase (glutamine-hydrolysing)